MKRSRERHLWESRVLEATAGSGRLEIDRVRSRAAPCWLLALAVCVLALVPVRAAPASEDQNTCVDCHSDKDLLVVNKKLYDYYQEWQFSVHAQEAVKCVDCHGGNPALADKRASHGAGLGESSAASAVNFRNIPETCGRCHEGMRDAYAESEHSVYLDRQKGERQGPNCVTCHGSMGTSVPNVTSVEAACARCHNDETGNRPEIPGEARVILNKFLSIDRFYRYIRARLEPEERGPFLDEMDVRIRELSRRWHTFDLEEIEKDTRSLLSTIKQKRDEVRRRGAGAKAPGG